MNLQSVVDQVAERFQDVSGKISPDLLQNRWLQLGVAAVIGYAVGRTRSRVHLGPFARTLATAAVTTLVRTALHSRDRNQATASN